jgi:hypothetical protein
MKSNWILPRGAATTPPVNHALPIILPLDLGELEEQPTGHLEGQSVVRIAHVLYLIADCRILLGDSRLFVI